jgi:hypothetical protein
MNVLLVNINLLEEIVLLVKITVISVNLVTLVWHVLLDILTWPALPHLNVNGKLLLVKMDNSFKLVLMLVKLVIRVVLYVIILLLDMFVLNVLIQPLHLMVKIVLPLLLLYAQITVKLVLLLIPVMNVIVVINGFIRIVKKYNVLVTLIGLILLNNVNVLLLKLPIS